MRYNRVKLAALAAGVLLVVGWVLMLYTDGGWEREDTESRKVEKVPDEPEPVEQPGGIMETMDRIYGGEDADAFLNASEKSKVPALFDGTSYDPDKKQDVEKGEVLPPLPEK